MTIEEYLKNKREEQGDMHKHSHYNDYCTELLNDIDSIVDEIHQYDYFDDENKELIKNIIKKLCNVYCEDSGELIDIIKNICTS